MESKLQDSNTGRTLITGATGFIGSRLTRALMEQHGQLVLLCRPASAHGLERWLDRQPSDLPRPTIVSGDIGQADLAMPAAERAMVRAETDQIYHLAASYDLALDEVRANKVNLDGTRHLLDLASGVKGLKRFHYASTLAVAGDFEGVYLETNLDLGQEFFHPYGRSKFLAEKEVQTSSLPTTIYRPGVVVGDSQTGAMDKIDGPYLLFSVLKKLKRLPGITRLPMIAPRGDQNLFHLVPVDYVVSAMVYLAQRAESLDKTYHLTDPDPVSFRQFYLATLEEMGFTGPTIARPVQRLIRLLMKPGLWQMSRALGRRAGLPAEMLPHVPLEITYDNSQAQSHLAGSGISCPNLLEYLPRLIGYFESHLS